MPVAPMNCFGQAARNEEHGYIRVGWDGCQYWIDELGEAPVTSLDQRVNHQEDGAAFSGPVRDPISPRASDPKTQDRI